MEESLSEDSVSRDLTGACAFYMFFGSKLVNLNKSY